MNNMRHVIAGIFGLFGFLLLCGEENPLDFDISTFLLVKIIGAVCILLAIIFGYDGRTEKESRHHS